MKGVGSMKNIVRFEYGRSRAWWVRIERRGSKPGEEFFIRKLFSDGVHGGKRKSLKAAKLYRDANLTIAPEPQYYRQPKSRGRVYRELRFYYDRNTGDRIYYPAWSAWIKDDNGRARHTGYSINKHGYNVALKMAQMWLRNHRERMGR